MPTPNISIGQIAIDPTNKIFYFRKLTGELVSTTLDFLQNGNTEIVTSDNVTITASLTVDGNLTVNGTTTTINTETVLIEDNIIVLNSNVSATPSTNAGIEIERGTSPNVSIRWNESTGKWQFTNDGSTYLDISSIIADSVILGTHTVGNYVSGVSAGTGVIISHTPGEGSTPSFSIGQSVGTTDTVTFNAVNANLNGNVTGTVSDISNHGISDLSDVVISSAANGDFLRYNGANWINDPVNLATDTVGDYVSTISAGTGIAVSNLGGEGATPQISLNATLDDLLNVNLSSATPGQIMIYLDGQWVNSTFPSMEPMGFENANDSNITFSNSTREFTISPVSSSFTIWSVGKRYVKTTSESISLPNLSNLYYIYYNTSGALAYKTTFFTLSQDTPVAYVYWNQTDGVAHFIADERHGVTLDWATHEYLHRTRGAAIANGFGANNYTTSGNGSLNSHAQIDIAEGTFFDEDLRIVITNSATPAAYSHQQVLQGGGEFPVFYRTNSHYRRDSATKFPMKIGSSRVTYNLYSGGLWSTPDIDTNKFGITYLVATNDLNNPIFAMMGQAQYTDQGSAEAASWNDMNLDDFPVAEFRILYKLIYQTSNAYTNTPKARLTGVQDLRVSFISGGNLATVPVSDHGTMTGLSDDDHTQYFNSARHDAHDHSAALNSATLNDLGDVTITSVATNQGLIWNGSAWVNSTIPLNLDGLSDVIITSATPNQVLKYDGTNWVNAAAPSGVVGSTYFATIGDGSSSSFVLNHGLSTRDIIVTFTDAVAPYSSFLTTWDATDLNNITIYFENPPASNSVRVSIYSAASGVTANVNSINDILDVDITSASPNQVLTWSGSAWINSTPSGGGSVNSYATTIGDGSNLSYTITHNLGTRDIILQARNVSSPYENYNVAWEATTINTATVYFDSAPASNSVRIKVIA